MYHAIVNANGYIVNVSKKKNSLEFERSNEEAVVYGQSIVSGLDNIKKESTGYNNKDIKEMCCG